MIKRVVFFNHYHNGDIFHSKGFVQTTMNRIAHWFWQQNLTEPEFAYAHRMHPDVLNDFNTNWLKRAPHLLQHLGDKVQVLNMKNTSGDDTTLFINTWVGAYFNSAIPYDGECTLRFNFEMWKKIYEQINAFLGKGPYLSMENNTPLEFLPDINETKLSVGCLANIREATKGKSYKVLFCNGPVHSGQCPPTFAGDLSPIIDLFATRYPEIDFFHTHPVSIKRENLYFTDSVINKSGGCDLNEIGYLSTYCNLIVGRYSGPFCFAANKKNLMLRWSHFYGFGVDEKLWFPYDMELRAKHTHRTVDYQTAITFYDIISDIEGIIRNAANLPT